MELGVALSAMKAALHFSSELLILVLPLIFIKNLQMSKVQKVNAAGIFGIVIITITTGTLRTIAALCWDLNFNNNGSITLEQIMNFFEPPLAVIVCALPAYKVLLSKLQKRKKKAAEARQNAASVNVAVVPPPERSKPMRNVGVQDSITELEMA